MTTYHQLKQIVDGYGKWVDTKIEKEGYEAYLLSFMFHALRGSHIQVHQSMTQAVERAYAKALTRVFRYPKSQIAAKYPMLWFVVPDRPVPKHERKRLWEVRLNDGVHMHAIALVPPFNRLKQPLDQHLMRHQDLYAQGPLMRLHAVGIDEKPAEVTDYSMKSVKRGTVDYDDILILPRMPNEVPARERGEEGVHVKPCGPRG